MSNKDYELVECPEKDNSLGTTVENLQLEIQKIQESRNTERFIWILSFLILLDLTTVFDKINVVGSFLAFLLELILLSIIASYFKLNFVFMIIMKVFNIAEKYILNKKAK